MRPEVNQPPNFKEWLRRRQRPMPESKKTPISDAFGGLIAWITLLAPFTVIGGLIGNVWRAPVKGGILGLIIGFVTLLVGGWLLFWRMFWKGL